MENSNICGFHHVALKVKDFDKAMDFYKKLGFKVYTRWGDDDRPVVLIDTGNNNYIELFNQGDEIKEDNYGYIHLAFSCDDVQKMYDKAIECGAKPNIAPKVVMPDSEPLKITINCAFVIGPNGEQIEFFKIL